MFIYQGQKSFYLWNKINPEIDESQGPILKWSEELAKEVSTMPTDKNKEQDKIDNAEELTQDEQQEKEVLLYEGKKFV